MEIKIEGKLSDLERAKVINERFSSYSEDKQVEILKAVQSILDISDPIVSDIMYAISSIYNHCEHDNGTIYLVFETEKAGERIRHSPEITIRSI